MIQPITLETSPAIRALQSFADYDTLRLRTYRDREVGPARIQIRQFGGASLLRFEDVGYFNRIYAPQESVAKHLGELEAFYKGSRFGCELVAGSFDDGPLGEACSRRGWQSSHRYAWMHMEANEGRPNGEYPGVSVREPEFAERTSYLEFYLRGFDAPAANFPAAIQNMRHLFDLPQLRFLVAVREGRPAAIGMLCAFGETALLVAGATLPEERRHGCHHALLEARIRLASELGCKEIVSYAYAGGQSHRNMESMGLRTVDLTTAWRFPGAGGR